MDPVDPDPDPQHRGEYGYEFARTDIRKYSFAVRVVEPWNRLPDTLKKQRSFQERVEATEKIDPTRDQNWLSEKTT